MSITSTDKSKSTGVVMVVQSLPPLPGGGAEIQALRLSEELIKKGISVFFISPGTGRIKCYSEINGIPIYRLHTPLNYLLDLLFFIQKKSPQQKTVIEFDDSKASSYTISRKIGWGARLRYLIFLVNAYFFLKKKKSEFQVIHSHTIEWPGYVSAVLSKWLHKKLIIKDSTMNGIFNILRFPSGKKKQELIIRQAHFVAMTKVIESNLMKAGISKDRISKIPNGIHTESNFKTDYRGSENVLFVGNLYQQPAKGADILLKAWKKLTGKFTDATLHIAGDGDINAYREYAQKLGIGDSVLFLGKNNDVHNLMLNADVFVLPSRREGMPNVLMEAMLRAVPCVATDISGSQDLIKNNHSGLLVPPADVDALADKLYFMLTNRDQAALMGMNARKEILDRYDIRNVASEYVKLYGK